MGMTMQGAADFDKILQLFRGPNSSDLYERHIAAVEKLCRQSSDGFAIRDLPKVQQILELTLGLISSGSAEFLQPGSNLLRTLAKPFVKKSSTDEFKLVQNITDVLAAVGRVFTQQLPVDIQLHACEMLSAFATAHGPRPQALELGMTNQDSASRQYHTNQMLISNSGVIASTVRGLACSLLAHDTILAHAITSTLVTFSFTPGNCSELLDYGILVCLPQLLAMDYKAKLASQAVEALWNILELAPEPAKAAIARDHPTLLRLACGFYKVESTTSEHASTSRSAVAAAPPGPASRPHSREEGQQQEAAAEQATEASSAPAQADASAEDATAAAAATASFAAAPADEQQAGAGADTDRSGGSGAADAEAQHQRSTASVNGVGSNSSSGEPVVDHLAAALTSLFTTNLYEGFRLQDKEMRNDTLAVINILLEQPLFAAKAHAAGLFPSLLTVSTCPDLHAAPDHTVQPWALTTEELDYELKQLAWKAVTSGSFHCPSQVLPEAVAAGFITVILSYVEIDSGLVSPVTQRWSADQHAVLRSAAFTSLHKLAPLSHEAYLAAGGMATIQRFLHHGTVHVHVEAALRHLYRLVTVVPELGEVVGAQGLMHQVLNLVQDTAQPRDVRHFALMIVSALTKLSTENQRKFRKESGVQVLLAQLVKAKIQDHTLPSPYTLAVLDAIWNAVAPDRKNLARFLVEDGLDGLLNLLEVGNKAHRPVILSMLADILENPKSHTFFHDWRSDTNKQTASHMLIVIWQEEDVLRGMTNEGVLANTRRPLTGLDKRTKWVPAEAVAYGNMDQERRAWLELMTEGTPGEHILAKIYAIFKLLGFANITYLDDPDKAVMCLMEKYVKFKQGEVWQAIQAEFEATGMRPTAADRERLASGIELSEHLAKAVLETQAAILRGHKDTIKAAENKFFESIQNQRKLEQEAKFYQKDKSQMTMTELREAKQKKEAMLRNSIKSFQFMDPTELGEAAGDGTGLTPLPAVGRVN